MVVIQPFGDQRDTQDLKGTPPRPPRAGAELPGAGPGSRRYVSHAARPVGHGMPQFAGS